MAFTRLGYDEVRALLCRSTIGLEDDLRVKSWPKPTLVVTSSAVPRRAHSLSPLASRGAETHTSALLAGVARWPFWLTLHVWESDPVRAGQLLSEHRGVVSIIARRYGADRDGCAAFVGFSHAASQLPRYLSAMGDAGFTEWDGVACQRGDSQIWRTVPNRKWYCHNGQQHDSGKEVVLFHRPTPAV